MGAELLWGRHDALLAREPHSHFGSLLDPDAVVGPRMVAGDVTAYREERPGVTIGERRLSVTAPRTLWTVTRGARGGPPGSRPRRPTSPARG